jgi:Fe-S cluster biogenesis protein NfuA
MELERLLDRMEELLAEIEALEDAALREQVFELLDAVDALHRMALKHMEEILPAASLQRLREDPAVAWMLDAYAVGIDEAASAEAALETMRPYIHSHGGKVELLSVRHGVVRVRMSGACAGCNASAVTLREGIEQALRENLPGFAALEAEEEDAPAHEPPGPTLLQIRGPEVL